MEMTYNPYNGRSPHGEIALYLGINEKNTQWHSAPKLWTPQTSPIDCDELQLINA